jgi:hypothetical protein
LRSPGISAAYLSLLLRLVIQHPALAQSSAVRLIPGSGAVEGRVFDERGQPVPGAAVYAFQPDRSGPGLRHEVRTDGTGSFFLDSIQPGLNRICAVDETEYYPDTNATFYDSAVPYPEVNVHEGKVVRGVVIRVGPKAGRLVGKVLDSNTNSPIRRAGLTFYDARGTQEYMGTGLRLPALDFNVLVPSTKPFRMKVWAPGYQTWYYGKDGTQAGAEPLRLSPGKTKEMIIRLRPLQKHTR